MIKNKYEFVCDRLEVRSSIKGKNPEYIVRGYASIPNQKDIYRYQQNEDGTITSFKSLFTSNAISSMEKQAKAKKIFVDAEHQTAALVNIRSILKGISDEFQDKGVDISSASDQILDLMKNTDLPFAKVTDIKVDENGLFIDTRLNPSYRDLNPQYFDAVWNSINHGFINGISINFVPTEVVEEFRDGEYVSVINDVDLFGFSYVGNPALPDNNIVEVAMRSMMEFRSTTDGGKTMTEQPKVEDTSKTGENTSKTEVEALKKELEELKAQNAKKESEAKEAEKQKQADTEKQEYQNQLAELQKTVEELKKANSEKEVATAKGTITQEADPAKPQITSEQLMTAINNLDLGRAIVAQAEFNTTDYYDDNTKQALKMTKGDIIAPKHKN